MTYSLLIVPFSDDLEWLSPAFQNVFLQMCSSWALPLMSSLFVVAKFHVYIAFSEFKVNVTAPRILRPHRGTMYMDAAYCYSSVVCRSVTVANRAKTAELIKTQFEFRTWVGPRNHVLDVGTGPQWKGEILRGKGWPIVKYSDPLSWAVQKWLEWSRCHLRWGFGWTHGIM